MSHKDEILFNVFSYQWVRDMPVTLITYDDGEMDLLCQTGDHYNKAMRQAHEFLGRRGLKLEGKNTSMIGPWGVYRRVVKNGR